MAIFGAFSTFFVPPLISSWSKWHLFPDHRQEPESCEFDRGGDGKESRRRTCGQLHSALDRGASLSVQDVFLFTWSSCLVFPGSWADLPNRRQPSHLLQGSAVLCRQRSALRGESVSWLSVVWNDDDQMIMNSTLNPGWDFGEEFLWPARVFRSVGRALWEGGAYGYRGGGGAMMDSLIRRLIERVCEFYASPEDHLFWIPSKCVFLASS